MTKHSSKNSSYLNMAMIVGFLAFAWVSPIMITPDTVPLDGIDWPLIATNHQNKVWFAWGEIHGVPAVNCFLARYYENNTLSQPDTVMRNDLVDYLQGLTHDNNGNIWILGDDDVDIWTRFHNGSQWSDSIKVPYNGWGTFAGADSIGNYWVAWSNDLYGFWSVQSSFYNGSSWSPMIPVSNKPTSDCWSCGMATTQTGILWHLWGGWPGVGVDTLFVSTYNGSNWTPGKPIASNVYWMPSIPSIITSIVDTSIYISLRHNTGYNYILKYPSFGAPCETLWVNNTYETAPVMTCDDLGRIWLFFCDSLGSNNYRLYYAIYAGDSVTTPALVDTAYACRPSTIFDTYHRRVWITYMQKPSGTQAIYATYMDLEVVNEKSMGTPYIDNILSCHPNPARYQTNIKFCLREASKISLDIYDICGRLVDNILSEFATPGDHSAYLFLKDYATGTYHIVLHTQNKTITKHFSVIK